MKLVLDDLPSTSGMDASTMAPFHISHVQNGIHNLIKVFQGANDYIKEEISSEKNWCKRVR